MFSASKTATHAGAYATREDFCRIFANSMDPLYLLSLVLTADHETAEKCFVGGLEDSSKANSIFREWAESWARRSIMQQAIHRLKPQPADDTNSGFHKSSTVILSIDESEEIAAILALPVFERFVFVMSVLEHYSDQECSLLLGCARSEVREARVRALYRIGKPTKPLSEPANMAADSRARTGRSGVEFPAFSTLATSA